MSDADPDDMAQEGYHAESVAWVASKLDRDEMQRFGEGLEAFQAKFRALIDSEDKTVESMQATIRDYLRFVKGWTLSVQMREDRGWREELADADLRWERGEGDLVDAERLRTLLGP
jgi:hypothetical protein